MGLSHYTADSFLLTLYEAELMEFALTNETLAGSPIPLTTTYLDGLLPGLVKTFGADQPVKIDIKATRSPNSLFEVDKIGIISSLDLSFIV